ncbi:MAG TPA: SDR family oxidoreductase [Bryobacteraceae bacterium]
MANVRSWLALAGWAGAIVAGTVFARRAARAPLALAGKTVLITGGSRGLGLSLAYELGRCGCRIAICARDAAELEAAQAQLAEQNIEAAVFPADIANPEEARALVERAIEHFGRLDILVNNAGSIKVAPFEALEHSDFEEAMNLMFWAPVNLSLAVLPHMRREDGGTIVNIASVGGRVSVPHLLPYCCAKFALTAFSTGLGAELRAPLHMLTVVPGLMRTGSYLNAKFRGQAEQEFAWFSLLGNLPAFSVSADHAARTIREAMEHRKYTCTISLPANLLIRSEAVFPETTRIALAATSDWLLPDAHGQTKVVPGKFMVADFGRIFQAFTSLGRQAAENLNE